MLMTVTACKLARLLTEDEPPTLPTALSTRPLTNLHRPTRLVAIKRNWC